MKINIPYNGLIAGVKFLQVHCEGFDDGTGDDFQTSFIRRLLTEIFLDSGITLEMPDENLSMPETNSLKENQDMGRLMICVPETDDVDYGSEFFVHRS